METMSLPSRVSSLLPPPPPLARQMTDFGGSSHLCSLQPTAGRNGGANACVDATSARQSLMGSIVAFWLLSANSLLHFSTNGVKTGILNQTANGYA